MGGCGRAGGQERPCAKTLARVPRGFQSRAGSWGGPDALGLLLRARQASEPPKSLTVTVTLADKRLICQFKSIMKLLLPVALISVLATGAWAAGPFQPEPGFVSLFDGKTLDGWKVGNNAAVFQVRDGMIVMDCPTTNHQPAHLFYVGSVRDHAFKNFDLRVDLMTFPCANSGIYFHTEYQEAGWPKRGLECQVDNTHSDWRRTGSLWGVRNISWGPETPPADTKEMVTILPKPPVADKVWYTQEVIYQNGLVTVKLNGQTMFEYKLPDADSEHKLPTGSTWLPLGTFALQGHPPMPGQISKVYFKNIRVQVLPD